jgi:murein DD-endopeptidase / murein LD-carboxypeptidase
MIRSVYLILILVILSSSTGYDRLGELIDRTENVNVKRQLKRFAEGGIEKRVDTSAYNADSVIEYARTFIGTPHRMRGTTRKGIDCSGLVLVSHKKFGVTLPHSSHEQARYGIIISNIDSLRKGDLVFFYGSYDSKNFITHAGIYLGDKNFIHASNKSGVIISKVDGVQYWGKRYLFGTRLKE